MAAGGLLMAVTFVPLALKHVLSLPDAVVAGILFYAACYFIVSGAELSLSRMLSPRRALVIGLSVQDTTLGTTIANLGMTDTRFANPLFAGDTVRVRTTVMDLRESKSRPNAGIVTFLHQGFQQDGKEVCTCTRQALMLRRPA